MSESAEVSAGAKGTAPFGRGLFAAAWTWGTIAFVTILVFFLFGPTWREVALSAMILFASAAVGSVVGFIFGVPKSIVVTTNDDSSHRVYHPNSNLETISDWLTKILVGVGLVEFRQLLDAIGRLGSSLGPLFGDQTTAPSVGATYSITLVLGGAIISFLITYMWTRTRLYQVLAQHEQDVS